MLGAIAGDIIGSRWEFSRIKTRDFPLFPDGASFTDDTVLTCAVADHLINGIDIVESLRDWVRVVTIDTTRVSGYGQRFMRWAAAPTSQPPYGSYGNGGAMRVSPCAWLSPDLESLRSNTVNVTEVTHDHPEGIKGALATAEAIWFSRKGVSPTWLRRYIAESHGYDMDRSVDDIRDVHVRDETSQNTVPESIICALEANSFEEAVRNAVSLGGDTDTMASIAGAIAEASFGVPTGIEVEVRRRLDPVILDMLDIFLQRTKPFCA